MSNRSDDLRLGGASSSSGALLTRLVACPNQRDGAFGEARAFSCEQRAPLGFTVLELVVVVAIIALLVALLVPSLATVRDQARTTLCASNLRQLAMASILYSDEARGAAPPLAWWHEDPVVYWWGTNADDGVDHTASPLYKYLRSRLGEGSVFECPAQPWGSYRPQGRARQITSTYGYNGYYLSPAATPGWALQIGRRPWQQLQSVRNPGVVFMFADTLMGDDHDSLPSNNALLDPPYLFVRKGKWRKNDYPTTAFRHRGQTNAACCDGHVASFGLEGGELTSERHMIGYVGRHNDPHYVPDWQRW